MDEVSFNEEPGLVNPTASKGSLGLTSFVQKLGLAKNEQQAAYVLFGIAGVGILITLITLSTVLFGGDHSRPHVPTITGAPRSSTP
jgi:hypothetical protein